MSGTPQSLEFKHGYQAWLLCGFWELNTGSHTCVAKHLTAFIDKALIEVISMAQLSAHTLEDGRGPSEGPGLPLEAGAYICGTQA